MVPLIHTYTTHIGTMNLTQEQQETVNKVTRLVDEKYEELIWNECYYDGDNQEIKDLLGSLMKQGVEFSFSVNLKPYDNKLNTQ